MALIVDAGALFAQADRDDPEHEAVAAALREERDTLVSTQLAVAEADYLILNRLGVEAELAFLEDLAAGTFLVECLSRADLTTARDLVLKYDDLRPGLADCSIVIIAARYKTRRLLTLNQRDFRVMRPLQGGTFTLLPAD